MPYKKIFSTPNPYPAPTFLILQTSPQEPNPNLHPTIEDEALKVGIPRSTLEITPEDPIEYLKRAGDATTDSVVSSRYLDEISECDVLLREAYRVIKPGGSIVAWYRTVSE
eukprot:1264587-Amorphochlora_amoeboformis.AAC.1